MYVLGRLLRQRQDKLQNFAGETDSHPGEYVLSRISERVRTVPRSHFFPRLVAVLYIVSFTRHIGVLKLTRVAFPWVT